MIVGVREAVVINSYLHHLLHNCNIQYCVSVKYIYDYTISYSTDIYTTYYFDNTKYKCLNDIVKS